MADQRQLTHPPLKEALIDIQLAETLPQSFTESLEKETIDSFERKQKITTGTFEFKIGEPREAVKHNEEFLGWRYESADGSKVAQLKRNGLTYSILKDYRDWTEIRDAARTIWNFYFRLARQPITVARVAVRYINVLEFPSSIELNDYLIAAPKIPQGLPQTLENFLQRVVIPYQGNTHVIITQALEATSQPSTRVILDIDVFTPQLTVQGDSPDLWNLVDSFRSIKNTVFFSSVTETALKLYL